MLHIATLRTLGGGPSGTSRRDYRWGDFRGVPEDQGDGIRRSGHPGCDAGGIPGTPSVGRQAAVRRRPRVRQHAAGGDGHAGLGFRLPAFAVMLALTVSYSAFGVGPTLRGALYGLSPIVLAVFAVAVYRLGRTAVQSTLAGGLGLFFFYRRRVGVLVVLTLAVLFAAVRFATWSPAFLAGSTGSAGRVRRHGQGHCAVERAGSSSPTAIAIAGSSTSGRPTTPMRSPGARPSWRWTCTSTPISWTTPPALRSTSTHSCKTSCGRMSRAYTRRSPGNPPSKKESFHEISR